MTITEIITSAEVNSILEQVKDIKPPQYFRVSDLPPVEDAKVNVIYVMVQEWTLLDGELIRIS